MQFFKNTTDTDDEINDESVRYWKKSMKYVSVYEWHKVSSEEKFGEKKLRLNWILKLYFCKISI